MIERVWVDRRFEYADSLKEHGLQLLDGYKQPRVSYELNVVDMFPTSGDTLDSPRAGDLTRIIDDEIGIDYKSNIISVQHSDLFGAIPSTTITVENAPEDLAGTISDQADRIRIEETHAQGATNVFVLISQANANPSHPIVVDLFIPQDTKHVNGVNLRWRAEAFRADVESVSTTQSFVESTSVAPAVASTSASGGGANTSTENAPITSSTSASGGYFTRTLALASELSSGMGISAYEFPPYITDVGGGTVATPHQHAMSMYTTAVKANIEKHTHRIYHTHDLVAPNHTHETFMPSHSHRFILPTHTHNLTIPAHSHTVIIPAHNHAMRYGIYEGTTASNVTIKIGSNTFTVPQETDFDITDYLEKDAGGLIKRGTSHKIIFTPNILTRLCVTITPQIFIQSRGGGQY